MKTAREMMLPHGSDHSLCDIGECGRVLAKDEVVYFLAWKRLQSFEEFGLFEPYE